MRNYIGITEIEMTIRTKNDIDVLQSYICGDFGQIVNEFIENSAFVDARYVDVEPVMGTRPNRIGFVN